jgi:hypothetical protein
MAISKRIGITLAAVAVAGGIGATAFAAHNSNTSNTRPGWGYGDKNHVHTGPPGQSVKPGQAGRDAGEAAEKNAGAAGKAKDTDEHSAKTNSVKPNKANGI